MWLAKRDSSSLSGEVTANPANIGCSWLTATESNLLAK